jgi:hypothetical protein
MPGLNRLRRKRVVNDPDLGQQNYAPLGRAILRPTPCTAIIWCRQKNLPHTGERLTPRKTLPGELLSV